MGSSSYITDASGEVYQHLEYFAFGETFVKEHSNTDRTPYLYNGKELDEETGLYYYGARYYDARISIWLSADNMSEKAPGWTPYRAFFNNPNSWTDIDGNIELPLKGTTVANKKDLKGGVGLPNTVVRTSTYREIRKIGTSPHIGIDYRASIGTPFYSLGDGTVADIGETKSGIKFITVEYEGGDKIRFLHISSVADDIKKGSKVYEGQVLGETGNTGKYKNKKGEYVNYLAHLHVDGVDKDGNGINPEGKNYGNYTNKDFFEKYNGDYKNLPTNSGGEDNSFAIPSFIESKQDNTRVAKPIKLFFKQQKLE